MALCSNDGEFGGTKRRTTKGHYKAATVSTASDDGRYVKEHKARQEFSRRE
jgi:hypothetical protein